MRQRRVISAGVAVVLAGGVVLAGVGGTAHDFSGQSWSRGEMCLPCHTPHQGGDIRYSWNHAYPPGAAFTKRPGATLGFQSLACLGCHDGQTALDSFGGATGTTVMTGRAVVGRDLSDDHPVGVKYPASDRRYKGQAAVESDLRLYNGVVECGTCHDPHSNARGKFLRVDSRDLCQTCHDL